MYFHKFSLLLLIYFIMAFPKGSFKHLSRDYLTKKSYIAKIPQFKHHIPKILGFALLGFYGFKNLEYTTYLTQDNELLQFK